MTMRAREVDPSRERGPGPAATFRHFLALSRIPHSLIDMATPALAATLWLGRLPDFRVAMIGLATAFAGYTAVYALNDIVDCRTDRKKAEAGCRDVSGYLDAVFVRHPLAYDLIEVRRAVAWLVIWGVAAAVGAALLNPLCLAIFLVACVLEACYCVLCWVTPLRIFVSGVVKTLGAVAAILAVDRSPDVWNLLLLFGWLFFWELGGQNIPADWTDLEEDARLGAKTVPVTIGEKRSSVLVVVSLMFATLLHASVSIRIGGTLLVPYLVASIAVAVLLLLAPALRLMAERSRDRVFTLFNRASYYPLLLAAVTLARVVPGRLLIGR